MELKFGILATVEAKPGQEQAVWDFLRSGHDIVRDESGTISWYAYRINENTFGIFDSFETEEARQVHLNGPIPAALAQKGPDLFASDPDIRMVDIVAAK